MEYTIHLGEDTLKQLDEIVNGGAEGGGGGESDFNWNTATPHFTIILKEDNTFEFGDDAPDFPLEEIKNALDNGEIYFVKFSKTLDDELIEFLGIALYAKSDNQPYNAIFGCVRAMVQTIGMTMHYTESYLN